MQVLDPTQPLTSNIDSLPPRPCPLRYACWQPAEIFMCSERRRIAMRMLRQVNAFPQPGDRCLEIGFGTLGWLGELISWGMREADLHGIELDAERAAIAQAALPTVDLRVGDAQQLPWDEPFQLVIASTVFTSIPDQELRSSIAREITRSLAPGGVLLWYDFAFNSPSNPHVQKVTRKELRRLFPELSGPVRRITLAPPLVRAIAPRCWSLATILEAVPFLRTHLIAVLQK